MKVLVFGVLCVAAWLQILNKAVHPRISPREALQLLATALVMTIVLINIIWHGP